MSFGSTLKQAREAQGLSTQDLSLKTKIRSDYLRALEDGNTALLPERTFARSYLQRYARELGMDPAPLLSDFDRLLPASPEIAQSLQTPAARAQVGRRGLGPAALAGLATAAVVLGAGGYYLFNRPSAAPTPTVVIPPESVVKPPAPARTVRLSISSVPPGAKVFLDNRDLGVTPVKSFPVDARQNAVLRVEYSGRQSINQTISLQTGRNLRARLLPTAQGKSSLADLAVLQAAPKPAASGTPQGAQTIKPATPTPVKPPAAAVRVTFSAPSWTRITDKTGRVLFEGTPTAGTTKSFPAGVVIRAGNAGAVSVSVNGGAALALGGSGRVVTRSF
jgi:cytoskeleton protein RodZ